MKIKILMLCIISVSLLTGCDFKSGNNDKASIYTTIYPVQYIIDYLYGDNSDITSIYPDGADVDTYELTKKQIEKYAASDLFVYVGLGREKEMAKDFLNENGKLLIIDATYGLNYNEDLMELWLAPNNFLMLAKNIKSSLNEVLDNSYHVENVNDKYDKLYEKVSWVDAELRNVARDAQENNNNTLIVASDVLKFLENYGFEVISLEELSASGSDTQINDLKSKFKNSTYSKIIKLGGYEDSKLVQELTSKYKAKTVSINDIMSNSDSASDYITLQYENISVIREYIND